MTTDEAVKKLNAHQGFSAQEFAERLRQVMQTGVSVSDLQNNIFNEVREGQPPEMPMYSSPS